MPESRAVPNGKHGFVRAVTWPSTAAPWIGDINSSTIKDEDSKVNRQETIVDDGIAQKIDLGSWHL